MQYVIAFLEGIITFISPVCCPCCPSTSYFAGGGERSLGRTLRARPALSPGLLWCSRPWGRWPGRWAAFAGASDRGEPGIGRCGDPLRTELFGRDPAGSVPGSRRAAPASCVGFFPALLLGIVFSVGWTPCVGAFSARP